jgi:peptide/nickel transport system substrate-binding protein
MIRAATPALFALFCSVAAAAPALVETPMFKDDVASGKLPAVSERVPAAPLIVPFKAEGKDPGQPGGTLNMLIGRSRDVRMLVVYGYARLVGYDTHLQIVPDILESLQVEEGRSFTLKIRKGIAGRTASRSPPRIFATTGKTSPTTRS